MSENENAVRGSASQARSVIDIAEKAARLGYFVFDADLQKTKYASPGLRHIVSDVFDGVDNVELSSLFESVHSDDRHRVMDAVLATIHSNAPLDIEFRVISKDNGLFNLWMTNAEVTDPELGPINVGIVQDLTERRKSENKQRENMALTRSVIDAGLDAIVIIDRDGVINDFNPAAEATFGYLKSEIVGKRLSDTIVPPHYRKAHNEGFKRYLKTGEAKVIGKRIEIEAINRDGVEFPIELTIKQINVADRILFTANIRDISERRKVEQEREQNRKLLASAQRIAELGSWRWDPKLNRLIFSDEAKRILGLGPDGTWQTLSQYFHLVPSYDRKRLAGLLREAMSEENITFEVEHRIRRSDGAVRIVYGRAEGGLADDQETQLIGTLQDITDIRETQADLEKAKEDAEAANRAKSEFLAAMSHEIRTPLNGVLGMLTLLSDTSLTDEQQRLLKTAYRSGNNLLTLISDILDISKIEAGQVEQEFVDFDPLAVAQEAVELVEALAIKKSIATVIDVEAEVRPVRSDQAQIRQILTNLVSNAAKFTQHGSIIIRIKQAEDRLKYEVEDTGIGVAKEDQSLLFEKFRQVDPSKRRKFGGTGLGLSICKELVEHLGGEIGVRSEADIGSTFWFEIPVSPAEAPNDLSTTSEQEDTSHIGIDSRILLAEDSHTNALVASSYLRSAGAKVDIAANGHEVVAAVLSSEYDIIIMDVAMPDMDGIEATQKVRSMSGWRQSVPILALTANASRDDRARCIAAGMDDFLTKPLDPDALERSIARHVRTVEHA